ncbi:MAG TPA: ETX/MTX2 family pore-forming toxin [Ktedonobacteraceae bacterium]|nr:ETX/MTX2 family pore-forming toxin [Ktedonobacteraceae bacterium]
MLNKGSKLETNQSLNVGDSLISDNGCFRATMQGDGNFVIYQETEAGEDPVWASGVWPGTGDGPYVAIMQDDGNFVVYQNHHDPIWASGIFPGAGNGPYVAIMQDDGNFVVYQKNRHPIWATHTQWELLKVELSNVVYDFNRETMKERPDLLSEVTRTLINETSLEQEQTVLLEYEHTETDSWSHGLDIKAGVRMEMRAGLPCIVGGRVGIAGEGTYHHTSDKQRTTLNRHSFSTRARVPPHSRVTCKASLSTVQITLPYSAEALYHLKNGRRLRGQLKGGYQGTKAYRAQVAWEESVPLQ